MTTKKHNKILFYNKYTVILAGLFLGTLCLYIFFLNQSIVNVVTQKHATREAHTIQSEIALLEAEYITAQHELTVRLASRETPEEQQKIFAVRNTATNLASRQ